METDKFYRGFFLLLGFAMAVAGGISVIAYLNLLAVGYSLGEYFIFISRRIESYLLPFGLIVITASIYYPINEKEK
ncbi:hypothetical protein ACF5W4_05105 [Bacillota bacterium Lsc_1132]